MCNDRQNMANDRQNFRNNTVPVFSILSNVSRSGRCVSLKHLEVNLYFSKPGVTSVNQTSVNFYYQTSVDLRNFNVDLRNFAE
jgi:hypothetical protein